MTLFELFLVKFLSSCCRFLINLFYHVSFNVVMFCLVRLSYRRLGDGYKHREANSLYLFDFIYKHTCFTYIIYKIYSANFTLIILYTFYLGIIFINNLFCSVSYFNHQYLCLLLEIKFLKMCLYLATCVNVYVVFCLVFMILINLFLVD